MMKVAFQMQEQEYETQKIPKWMFQRTDTINNHRFVRIHVLLVSKTEFTI